MEDYRKYKNLIHLRGLFCLAVRGRAGDGSGSKLSRLQTDWQYRNLGTHPFGDRRLFGWLSEAMERRKAGGVRGSADEGEAAAPRGGGIRRTDAGTGIRRNGAENGREPGRLTPARSSLPWPAA